jgi:hypothetical protein
MDNLQLKSADISFNEVNENIEQFTHTEPKQTNKKNIPFWSENPNVLLQSEYITEFYPIETMSYEQKLNAITRTILVLSIICFLFTQNIRIIFVLVITIAAIFILYFYHQKEKQKAASKKQTLEKKENFENPTMDYLNETTINETIFDTPTANNPFSNVLVTDYQYNINKKPAPASFNSNVSETILEQAKQLVRDANPDQPDISDKLFKDLGDQFVFEQSLMPFNSMPNTAIPNDQAAFAEFCYGSMVSCREGNRFACARNLSRYTN